MTTSKMLTAAETWEKMYQGFEQINFTAYDFNTVKQSLLDYLKLQYPENFNDYIESSQMIAILEMFAYITEILAYRVDLSIHENELGDAQRKASILRLAKLISYKPTRNLPLRGLVKVTSVTTSEDVRDGQDNSLANRAIKWSDPSNMLWRDQFFLVINRIMTQEFGNPFKSFQLDDTIYQQYEFANVVEGINARSSFKNGVLKFTTSVNGTDLPFEVVPADVDQSGVLEREPNPEGYFTLLYSDDGFGDTSGQTGFMFYVKQGTLTKLQNVFDIMLPNRTIDINLNGLNNVDVWVQQIDDRGVITKTWEEVNTVNAINIAFNNIKNQYKYEVESLENDAIRLIFGDGDFAAIPTGIFNIWVRQSNSGGFTVQQSQLVDVPITFLYTSKQGKQESATITFSLTSALQNSAVSEDIEHIRSAAPAVYYAQNRMVNGPDYNSFFLKDPSILRLYAVNRTFAGQPKYLNWNDASGSYQNIKLFGNDMRLYYNNDAETIITLQSSRSVIDDSIESALSSPGVYNLISYAFFNSPAPLKYAFCRPRSRFIEDETQLIGLNPLKEKTAIQGALDRHWYGEPVNTVLLDTSLDPDPNSILPKDYYAVVSSMAGPAVSAIQSTTNDTDHRIWNPNMKMVTLNTTTGVYTLVPTPLNVSGYQESVRRQRRFGIGFNPNRQFASQLVINDSATVIVTSPDAFPPSNIKPAAVTEDFTVEITAADGTFSVYGSVTGGYPAGLVGQVYDNGRIRFLIGFPTGANTKIVVGDSWLIRVTASGLTSSAAFYKQNLTGLFYIIDENLLPANAETLEFSLEDPVRSWVLIIERYDDGSPNSMNSWVIIKRNFALVAQSATTRFWYDHGTNIVDSQTKTPVFDTVRILKSNLDQTRTRALGSDQIYAVVNDMKFPDGTTNYTALSVTPKDDILQYSVGGIPQVAPPFLSFIGPYDYVYFTVDAATGRLTPMDSTSYVQGLTYYTNGLSVDGGYARRQGRDHLDFMWQHFTEDDRLVDPSPSNIIDVYVLTQGYYSDTLNYISGITDVAPTPPSALSLRNTYSELISSKMISDSVVMHSGLIKHLFGNLAIPQLRATFKVVMSPTAKLTGDQARARVLDLINQYFSIDNWDFGQSFFATELCAVIHQSLSTEISSVVLVPQFPSNYFGDMFYLQAGPNEIFMSCAKLENIELVTNIDRLTLKQKP